MIFKRKIISAKIEKIFWQITVAALMQPFQYDLRSSAAKDKNITHAAAAPSNLDAATTMRSAETELQNTKKLRAMASEIAALLKHFLKIILKGKLLAPKLRQSSDKSLSQPGCSHFNTVYNLQLQKTIVLRMQPFQCDPQPEIQETHRTTQTDTTTRCKTHRRNQFAHETTPAAPVAHTRYLSSSAAATLYGKTHGFVLRLPPHKIAHATFMQPFQCDPQPEIQETHRTTQTDTTTRCKTHRRNQFAHETTPAAPAAHTRYLSSSAAATLYGKTQGFVLRLPPHKIAHATLTQPFQCNLQPKIQEPYRTTRTDTTTRCKTHRRNQFAHETTPAAPVAQTRYLSSSAAATLYGKTQGFVLRLPPHKIAHATLTQPFQCDPQPEIQETHRTTQTDTTTRCKTDRRNQFAHETTPAAPAAQTRYLSSSPAATLYGETHGFVLRLPPHKIAHATFMQPFQCDPQPEIQETHRTTQTDTTTRCKTHRRNQFAHETTPAAPAAHTRYLSSSAAATLYGKTQGFVLRLPPHKIAHATFMQPFQCNLQPKIQEPHRTTRTAHNHSLQNT